MINIEYLKFFSLGDIYELNVEFDSDKIIQYCKKVNFKDRGNNVHSLSLTSIDGSLETAVDSGLRYIDGLKDCGINKPTPHFNEVSNFMPFLNECKNVLGRTRIFKGMPNAIWAPHRDGSSVIRIMIPLRNCEKTNFYFVFDGKLLTMVDGKSYVVNTLKEHAGIVFFREMYIMVLTLIVNDETAGLLTKYLSIK